MTNNQNNQDKKSQDPLQFALIQAAKVGNINLIKEFIEADADPFAWDASNNCAIEYALEYARKSDTEHPGIFLMELTKLVVNFQKKR